MYIWRDGNIVEMSADELLERVKRDRIARIEESTRPLTSEEVTAMLITQQVNTLSVDDNTALRMKQYYPMFDSIVGQTVPQGYKFQYGGKLWSVVQPSLTIQSHYPPGAGTESLYAEVCETHAGTLDDPIPYSGNMALELGKYYIQSNVIYLCIRDTGNPIYHALADLVEIYVEVIL
jgi:hypothetical protein